MSSIPFNTITSIVGTTNVQRTAAAAIDRTTQESIRTERVQREKSELHVTQIEDPADYGLESIEDDRRHNSPGQEQPEDEPKNGERRLNILDVQATPEAQEETLPNQPLHLDISA